MPGNSPTGSPSMEEIDVFDLLTSLTDRSLILWGEKGDQSRYRMLETVRQYGRDLLHGTTESEPIRNQHRDYFLSLSERSEPLLKGPQQMKVLASLEEEHENFRAALEWSLHGEGSDEGLRLAANLVLFWWRQGHLQEGTDWCMRASETAAGRRRTVLRSRVLNGAGLLKSFQGDSATSMNLFRESHEILVELGDKKYLSEALCGVGFAAFFMDDYDTARDYVRRSYQAAQEAKDRWYIAWTGYFLGILTRIEGDYDGAIKQYEEAIAIYRELGDRLGLSYPIYDVGLAEYYRGNLVAAKKYLEESLDIRGSTQDLWGTAESQFGLGLVSFGQGDLPAARTWLNSSMNMGKEIGDKTRVAISLHWLANLDLREGDEETARKQQSASLEIYREVEDRWGLSHCFAGFATLAAHGGDFERAIKLWGMADHLREEIGSPLPPIERAQRDREIAAARESLGDSSNFERALAEGKHMNLADAIALCAAD